MERNFQHPGSFKSHIKIKQTPVNPEKSYNPKLYAIKL